MTPLQLKTIHMACRQAGLVEAQYRTILRNVADVESSRNLTQAGFEDCMAVIEDAGFRERDKPGDYWRRKVGRRGYAAGERMVRKIEALASESRYGLAAMCRKSSADRTDDAGQLRPREAWMLVEMLKAEAAREKNRAAQGSLL